MDKLFREKVNTKKFKYDLTIKDREKLLNQKSIFILITGLSGSGKSTIANSLNMMLHHHDNVSYVLDGDSIRSGLNSDLDFSIQSRTENIRRVGELSNFFLDAGIITIVPVISPLKKHRDLIKRIVSKEKFFQVYLSTSIKECIRRDVKGLYKKAMNNEIKNFTGISSPYEVPFSPDIKIDTKNHSIKESSQLIFDKIMNRISYE